MKTLTVYALLLGTGLTTLLSILDNRESHVAQLSPIALESPFDSKLKVELPLPGPALKDSSATVRKKEYHIYFENRSTEAIEVAIRYKSYNGDWETSDMVTLAAGEKRRMGVSDEKTYFYYAENKRKWKKKKWKGSHHFSLGEETSNKVKFIKEQIWECYDTKRCNAFAVFR